MSENGENLVEEEILPDEGEGINQEVELDNKKAESHKPEKPITFIDYANIGKPQEDQTPIGTDAVFASWSKMPLIKNQLFEYPQLCERVTTEVRNLDFSNKKDLEEYQQIINRSKGEKADIRIIYDLVKFSEKTGSFIAFIMYDTFKFRGPLSRV